MPVNGFPVRAPLSLRRYRRRQMCSNPNLVTLTQAERRDGKLPVTMVPGGSDADDEVRRRIANAAHLDGFRCRSTHPTS
jgi:hypothetical protein